METVCQPNGVSLIQETCATLRKVGLRYAGQVSDKLVAQLNQYVEANNDVTDLADELGLLRYQVGQLAAKYEAATNIQLDVNIPGTLLQQQQYKDALIDIAASRLNDAINRVRETALSMSKIQAARNGRIDTIVLSQIAANLSQQVDLVLHEVGGVDSHSKLVLANRISDLLGSAFDGNNFGGSSVSGGPVVSTIPARISAEDILREMVASVPYCESRTENVPEHLIAIAEAKDSGTASCTASELNGKAEPLVFKPVPMAG